MRLLPLSLLAGAALIGFSTVASALPTLTTSFTISTDGPSDTGPLNTRRVFDSPNPSHVGRSITGDLVGTLTQGESLTLSGFNLDEQAAESFTSSFGTYQSTSVTLIGTSTANSVAYIFAGTFTPAGELATRFAPSLATVRISLSRSGNGELFSTSESATFSAPPEAIVPPPAPPRQPPVGVPEPATLALLGMGALVSARIAHRRR